MSIPLLMTEDGTEAIQAGKKPKTEKKKEVKKAPVKKPKAKRPPTGGNG